MYAVISDVHSNLDALNAVIKDIKAKAPGAEVLFLGDAVGYGPEPNPCVEIVRDAASILIAGNHDHGAIGLTDMEYFNPYAKAAILWTRGVLTEENSEYLKTLPLTASIGESGVFVVHSTPKEPEKWRYLLTVKDAEENFPLFSGRICFLGHSHLPFIIEKSPSGEIRTIGTKALLSKDSRYIVNPGSVGQPRDGDPRASYAILKGGEVEIIRVEYPVSKTQEKMEAVGLPMPLIERLSIGR